jgi:hypothetical protein
MKPDERAALTKAQVLVLDLISDAAKAYLAMGDLLVYGGDEPESDYLHPAHFGDVDHPKLGPPRRDTTDMET